MDTREHILICWGVLGTKLKRDAFRSWQPQIRYLWLTKILILYGVGEHLTWVASLRLAMVVDA